MSYDFNRAPKHPRKKLLLLFLLAAAGVIALMLIINGINSKNPKAVLTASNGIVFSCSASANETFLGEEPHNVEITVQQNLLTPNKYSRPQTSLDNIKGIVVHYVANPGSTAEQNRNYFENLRYGTSGTYASSHFIIGLDGEILQCIPLDEISYASNERNVDTISIECCHPDESGKFNDATYRALVDLTAWLAEEFHLNTQDVIRHYDVTGKACPKYFVDHEEEWMRFLSDVDQIVSQNAG